MLEFWKSLLANKQFIPHGHCYLWQPALMGVHILSDSLIALAYYSIPVSLVYFVRKRQDLPFNSIFLLFATFIITCGTSHFMEIWTLWYPSYWLSGCIKVVTALVSVYTSLTLIDLIPKALTLPSSAQLEAANQELEQEISDRQQAEQALQERETMLRRIGDNLPNGAIYQVIRELDGSDRFSYLSAGIQRLMEVSAEDAVQDARLLYRQFIPEDVPLLMAAVDESHRHLSVFDIQLRIQTPSGQIKWFHFRSTPRQLPDSRVVWDGLVVDVTDTKRAEEKLQRSEAVLATAQKIAQMGSWEWHLDPQQQIWSTETFRIFGLNPTESAPTQAEFLQMVYSEDRPLLEKQFVSAITTRTPFNIEYRIIRPDGSRRYLESRAEVAYDTQEQTIKLYGAILDITERKILEQELAHKQQLLNAFIFSAPVGITVLDQQLRYLVINDVLAQINGIPASLHIGKTPWEILPDLAPKHEQIFHDVFATGKAILDVEINGVTPKVPGVIRTWLASYFPIQFEVAKPIGIGMVVVEITERKRTEQMLELQAVITRNMAEGICLVSVADDQIVYANPKFEQMFGYDAGELVGQNVSILNYKGENSHHKDVNQTIRTAVLEHSEASYEVHNVKKDGTPFWCSATTSVFEHPEYGKVLVGVYQNITEQKQAEEKIKASLKEKEVLLEEIHHRVKNNLGIVSSLLQMQCRRTQDSQAHAILQDSQNRIASIALVHEKLYRSEDLENIDFAQYIPDLTTHLFDSYNISSSKIKLIIEVDNATLDIETAIPCGLIINELVSNALKYAFTENSSGEIKVKFYQQNESYLTLIIRDDGVGLPANFTTKKNKTLGTNLVQGLVKQLRGNLEINCQQGTEFKINFPKNKI